MPKTKLPIQIGQKVKFRPFENIPTMGERLLGITLLSELVVEGTVVSINEPHRWFSVEWGNPRLRTSFHFADIGPLERSRKADYPKYVEILN